MGISQQLIKLKQRKLGKSIQKNQKCQACSKMLVNCMRCDECALRQCAECLKNQKCIECNNPTSIEATLNIEMFKQFQFYCPYCATNQDYQSAIILTHPCFSQYQTDFQLINDLKEEDELNMFYFNEIKTKPNQYISIQQIEEYRKSMFQTHTQRISKTLKPAESDEEKFDINDNDSDQDYGDQKVRNKKGEDSDQEEEDNSRTVSKRPRGRPRMYDRDTQSQNVRQTSYKKKEEEFDSDQLESDDDDDSDDSHTLKRKRKLVKPSQSNTRKNLRSSIPTNNIRSKLKTVRLAADDEEEEEVEVTADNINNNNDEQAYEEDGLLDLNNSGQDVIDAKVKPRPKKLRKSVDLQDTYTPEILDEPTARRKKNVNQNIDNSFRDIADFGDGRIAKRIKEINEVSQNVQNTFLSKYLMELPQYRYDWYESMNQQQKLVNLLWTFGDEESSLYWLFHIDQIGKEIKKCCNHLCTLVKFNPTSTNSQLKGSLNPIQSKCEKCQVTHSFFGGLINKYDSEYTYGIILSVVQLICENIKIAEQFSNLQTEFNFNLLYVDIQQNLSKILENQQENFKLKCEIFVQLKTIRNETTDIEHTQLISIDSFLNQYIQLFDNDLLDNYKMENNEELRKLVFKHIDIDNFIELKLPIEFSKCSIHSFKKLTFQKSDQKIEKNLKIKNLKKELSVINIIDKNNPKIIEYEKISDKIIYLQNNYLEKSSMKYSSSMQFDKSFQIFKYLFSLRENNSIKKYVSILDLMKQYNEEKEEIDESILIKSQDNDEIFET